MTAAWRCFVALDLPAAPRAALAALLDDLRRLDAAVRWVDPTQLHVTLQFLGDVEPERVPALVTALHSVPRPPLQLTLERLGAFPPHGPARVLWAGLGGDVDALGELAGAVQRALAPLGFPPEARPFHPHVTLGRVKGPHGAASLRAAFVHAGHELPASPFAAEVVRLYRSHQGPQGSRYEELGSFPVGA